MKPEIRSLPDIAVNHAAIGSRHAELLASAVSGSSTRDERAELARLETELQAFAAMCTGHAPHCLMSTGLLWDDEIRHLAAPGIAARVRLSDRVEIDGETMSLTEATRRVATTAGRGVAIADWSGAGTRLGDALGLEHPTRTTQPQADVGSNYQLL